MARYLCSRELKDLSQDELVELVLRLQDQLVELERAGKRQAAPFGRPKPKTEPQKPGRKPGQGPFTYRPAPAPEAVTETKRQVLEGCPCCGGELTDMRWHEQHQFDIPPIQPIITCCETQSGYCGRCRRRQRSHHAEQLSSGMGAAGVSLGPRAMAMAADLKHRLGLSYEKIAELFSAEFGLDVSRSALCQADQRLSDQALPVYEELVASLRRSPQVHADETGWRIGGLSAWLWVFTNRHLTVYTVESGLGHGRSHQVVVKMLGEKFRGTLISDCFSAYDHKKFAGWLKQKCVGHLLKELSVMEEHQSGAALCFGRDVARLLRDALDLRDHKALLSPLQFKRRVGRIEARLDRLIDNRRCFSDPDNRRFARRLRKQREHLLRFLHQDGVDATNNQAERMLRPAVIVRKTGGCNKTTKGATKHAVLSSVFVTARQRGLSVINAAIKLQRSGGAALCRELNAAVTPLATPP